jgi:hypothetical protein
MSAVMPARSSAALMAVAPKSGAETSLNAPPNLPTGVLAPLTITASCNSMMRPSLIVISGSYRDEFATLNSQYYSEG